MRPVPRRTAWTLVVLACALAPSGALAALNFQKAVYPVDNGPVAVVTGTIGFGPPALVVANSVSGDISVLQSVGVGTFGPPTNYAAGSSPAGLAVGTLQQFGIPMGG